MPPLGAIEVIRSNRSDVVGRNVRIPTEGTFDNSMPGFVVLGAWTNDGCVVGTSTSTLSGKGVVIGAIDGNPDAVSWFEI